MAARRNGGLALRAVVASARATLADEPLMLAAITQCGDSEVRTRRSGADPVLAELMIRLAGGDAARFDFVT